MNKKEFTEAICGLVNSQTYQCYKGKSFKKDLRRQKKQLLALAESSGITLWDAEIYDVFQRFNLRDIDPKYLGDTLNLKF